MLKGLIRASEKIIAKMGNGNAKEMDNDLRYMEHSRPFSENEISYDLKNVKFGIAQLQNQKRKEVVLKNGDTMTTFIVE